MNHKLCNLSGNRKSGVYHVTIDPLAKRTALFLFILFQLNLVRAQSTPDSSRLTDTVPVQAVKTDTLLNRPIVRKPVRTIADTPVVHLTDTLRFSSVKPADFSNLPLEWMELLKTQAFFNFLGKPVHIRSEKYEPVSYDVMFYFLLGLMFYFAIVKLFFGKYMANLMTLFFRASMRQQQLREQVLQSPFPSLLLNILFVISFSLYCAFLMRYYHYGNPENFWLHFLYSAAGLIVLYLLKFLILKITGWIFNISRAVDIYLFVVFMTNKIIGIFLLPFLILISFSGPVTTDIGITVSVIMLGLFYINRFVAAYNNLYKEIKISVLHFFLYLCAFEIAPLLLIYKVLLTYLEKAY